MTEQQPELPPEVLAPYLDAAHAAAAQAQARREALTREDTP